MTGFLAEIRDTFVWNRDSHYGPSRLHTCLDDPCHRTGRCLQLPGSRARLCRQHDGNVVLLGFALRRRARLFDQSLSRRRLPPS